MQPITIAFSPDFKTLQERKLIPESIMPAYEGESSCIDLYCTEDTNILPVLRDSAFSKTYSRLVPTGMHIALKSNQTALILERGSIRKTPLKVRAGVIDPGFTAMIFVNCINLSEDIVFFKAGDKLPFQLLVVEHSNLYNEISLENFTKLTSQAKRQDGMIGSSDA